MLLKLKGGAGIENVEKPYSMVTDHPHYDTSF